VTDIGDLATHRSVVICAGPGGVGKTTTAAAIARWAARSGRRACVVTIDPAKRLADALGLETLTDEPGMVAGDWAAPGELWALMLDTKSTFDSLVRRYAVDGAAADTILANRFYRNISGALSGTQEYMAVEKLYELHASGRFDLVVVDTPPTRHALDFLDAPRRLTRFLSNRIFRMLMMPTRAGFRAVNIATQLFLRTISRVVGGEVVGDAIAFFNAFDGMEQGFRDRAAHVEALLSAPGTAYVVVAAPRRDAVDEAAYFADRLAEGSLHVSVLVVNRMFPRFAGVRAAPGPPDPGGSAGDSESLSDLDAEAGTDQTADDQTADDQTADNQTADDGLAALLTNLAQLGEVARGEEAHVTTLRARAPDATVARVPYLAEEVHDMAGLDLIGEHLFGHQRAKAARRDPPPRGSAAPEPAGGPNG
jgi:anion-transporting  ArsA/GET3 family ATPase